MEKKKAISIILILILVILGVVYFMIQNKQFPQSSPVTKDDVCLYLSNIQPYDCENRECKIKSEDNDYWNIYYRCPDPEQFPRGQLYDLKVNKNTNEIEVIGLTN